VFDPEGDGTTELGNVGTIYRSSGWNMTET